MSTSTMAPGPVSPRSPDLPPLAAGTHGHRPRWVVAAAVVAVVAVLCVVGWLVWSNWVPSAPGNLSAKAPTAVSVELSWSASTDGPDVDHYLVQRNGDQVTSLPADVTKYTDEDLVPDTTYRYTIAAASGSKRSDPSTELVVHTLPATPTDVLAMRVTSTTVRLTWSEPDSGPTPESWVVVRDGSEIATVEGDLTEYGDAGLAPAHRYTYQVIASSGTSRSAPSGELVVQTLPATPTGLKATAQTTTTVLVEWGYPTGLTPEKFIVLRDGDEVATLPATARAHVDKALAPATTYAYSVLALSGGQRSEETATVKATTRTPPVTDARLKGSYDVDGKITKSTAGITLGSAAALGQEIGSTWTFTPKCTTGACDTALSGRLAGHPFTMTLVRSGAVYSGSTKAHISHCEGLTGEIPVTNTITLQLTVRSAELSSKVWLADTWAATLRVTSPYTSAGTSGSTRYYCPSGSLTVSLTATR